MLIYIYFIIILTLYSPYCVASVNEWYFGIQGGLSSLTGKHHYANAGDGDKKEEEKKRANENNNNNNNNIEERYKRLLKTHNKLMAEMRQYQQNAAGGPVNSQGMRTNANVPVEMIDDMPREPAPQAVGAPPPPPQPPEPPANKNQQSGFSRAIKNHPLVKRNLRVVSANQPIPPIPPLISHATTHDSGISHHYGNFKLSDKNQSLGFHIGFLRNFNNYLRYVIGSEFYCNFNNSNTIKDLKVDGRASEGKVSIKQPYTLGIAGIAGYYVDPRILFYGKFGIEINKFINEYYDLKFVGASYPYNQSYSKERYNFSLRGFVPGVGVKFSTMKKIDLSLEYSYSMMQKIYLRRDDVTINSVNRGYLFQPNQHRFMMKLSYFIK